MYFYISEICHVNSTVTNYMVNYNMICRILLNNIAMVNCISVVLNITSTILMITA